MARAAHHRVQAPHDAGRPLSIRGRGRSFRSSTSTATSRRRSRPPTSTAWSTGMEQNNLRLLVNLSGGSGRAGSRQGSRPSAPSKYPDRMVLFANVDFREGVGPGFGAKAAAQLEADIKAGAKGLKIFKDLGLRMRRTDGSRLKLDDPELDPIWAACAPPEHSGPHPHRRAAGVLRADRPIRTNAGSSWRCSSSRRYPPDQAPRFEELMGERDRMFARHPKTRFIAAHFGVSRQRPRRGSAKLLDACPTSTPKSAAILSELGRQPRAAHDFFVKYQDRDSVRQGQLPARRVPVLLAHVRDRRRVLRLLPRLPRVLEAVRHGSAGRRAEEALLPERACAWCRACRRRVSQTDMAQYLVTGGAGFIGSHLSEELVRRGHHVRVADSLVTGKRSNLAHLPAVEFLEGDLADLEFARTRGRRASTTCCTRRRCRRCRGR